jgi:hypothetical protein
MKTLQEFIAPFRDDLLCDLRMSEVGACPKCSIMYVTGSFEDTCRYERCNSGGSPASCDSDSDSSDEEITEEVLAKKYTLVCIFDYDDTPLLEIVKEWSEKLYKLLDDPVQKSKWQSRINAAILDTFPIKN